MQTSNPPLLLGYSPVPRGMLATVVTFLERFEPPGGTDAEARRELILRRLTGEDLAAYRALYDAVGADLLWVSRHAMPDDALRAVLDDAAIEAYAVEDGGQANGIVELDFRQEGDCEIVYFGLVPAATGRGLGPVLMDEALRRAFARPIRRVWLHTCHFDHPAALGFYRRMGFEPYKTEVEVFADPRLQGRLPRSAAAHIPMIDDRP